MEKDFKKEYSKHIESETPDLWSRIESGITDKTKVTPITKKQTKIQTWKKIMPAAAAVVVLLLAAPVFMPRVTEKSADLAMFDSKAESENTSLKYEMTMDNDMNSVVEEGIIMQDTAETVEEAANEMEEKVSQDSVQDSFNDADGGAAGATTTGGSDSTTTPESSANAEMGKAKQDSVIEVKVLHFTVLDKTQDMNLLAIDKEHIGPVCDLYLIEVDGKEKVLAVPFEKAETEFEIGKAYDLIVTDSTEYGIDYIWAE